MKGLKKLFAVAASLLMVMSLTATAVYAEDEKIGYVANNLYTKSELTSSASELQDKLQNTAQGSYLLYLERYADIQFPIGRIIK